MIRVFRELFGYLLILLSRFIHSHDSGILSIYFHNPNKLLFQSIIKWLINNDYKFISVNDLERSIEQKLPHGKTVVITFDDGWEGNLDLLETIEKHTIPITVFIPVQSVIEGSYWWEYARVNGQHKISKLKNVEDFKQLPEEMFSRTIGLLKQSFKLQRSCMTFPQLKKLSLNPLVTIGSHTMTHPILTRCTSETQEYELTESKKVLSEWLAQDIKYLSYPNGDYDERTIHIAKECGYKLAFATSASTIDVSNVNRHIVPRYAINDNGGIYENIAKVLGVWQKVL